MLARVECRGTCRFCLPSCLPCLSSDPHRPLGRWPSSVSSTDLTLKVLAAIGKPDPMEESPSNLPEFLNSLEDFVPTVPDEFTEQLLEKCGVHCDDKRILRLVSLAAQRFVASALHDAKQVYSRRQKQIPARLKEAGYDIKDKRPVLLTEDLAEAMLEYGLNLKRPPYYADASSTTAHGK